MRNLFTSLLFRLETRVKTQEGSRVCRKDSRFCPAAPDVGPGVFRNKDWVKKREMFSFCCLSSFLPGYPYRGVTPTDETLKVETGLKLEFLSKFPRKVRFLTLLAQVGIRAFSPQWVSR